MILLTHIVIALAGIISASYGVMRPSSASVATSSALTLLTVLTGTVLMIQSPAHILHTCVVGLVYVAITVSGILVTKRKLARVTIENN